MQIKDYLYGVLNTIAECPFVESQNITFEERPPNAAFITGIISFINGSKLHLKQFVVFKPKDVNILKYGYNYLASDGSLIFRYDNAFDPKAKKFSTYPEHKHTPKRILPTRRPALKELLKEISDFLENISDLKAVKGRKKEPEEDYLKYSKEKKQKQKRNDD